MKPRRQCITPLSLDVLADLLDLPKDLKIVRIVEDPESFNRGFDQCLMLLEGNSLGECQEGAERPRRDLVIIKEPDGSLRSKLL